MNTEHDRETAGKKYKSPKWKLIRFFEGSRNKWKIKAKDAKYQINLLRKRMKYLKGVEIDDQEIQKRSGKTSHG